MRARPARLAAALLLGACALEGVYRAALLAANRSAERPGAFALYAAGDSTVAGEPFDPRLSLPEAVSRLMGGVKDGRPILVRSVGRTGESVYPQWRRLRLAAAFRRPGPGAVLIYVGHNEGDLRAEAPAGGAAAAWRRLERGWLSRSFVLTDLLYALRRYGGLEERRSLERYGYYLGRMIDESRERGLAPVVAAPVSNVAGVEPSVPDEAALRGDPELARGRALELAGRWREAVSVYERAAPAGRLEPYLYFRIAKCRARLGDHAGAREYFWKAVDADPRSSFGRATRPQLAALRETARLHGASLVDAGELFARRSPHALVGSELLGDFHHPTLEGYALLAEALARALGGEPAAATGEALARAFGFDDAYLARAHLRLGSNLVLYACADHPWPEERLSLARRNFERALQLVPGSAPAREGLETVAAMSSGDGPARRRLAAAFAESPWRRRL